MEGVALGFGGRVEREVVARVVDERCKATARKAVLDSGSRSREKPNAQACDEAALPRASIDLPSAGSLDR